MYLNLIELTYVLAFTLMWQNLLLYKIPKLWHFLSKEKKGIHQILFLTFIDIVFSITTMGNTNCWPRCLHQPRQHQWNSESRVCRIWTAIGFWHPWWVHVCNIRSKVWVPTDRSRRHMAELSVLSARGRGDKRKERVPSADWGREGVLSQGSQHAKKWYGSYTHP